MAENLSYEKMLDQYPNLGEYFPSNEVAQLLRGKRLMSPEEKIDIFGGVEKVNTNISFAQNNGSEVPFIVLLACERQHMTSREIVRFAYIATNQEYMLAIPTLFRTLTELQGEGFLDRVEGVTLIRKLRGDYRVTLGHKGYSITGGKAIEKRVELLEGQGASNSSRGFLPLPRPIQNLELQGLKVYGQAWERI